MLDLNSFSFSNGAIGSQKQCVMDKYPYITNVVDTNKKTAFKADYFGGVDAVGTDQNMRHYNIQFKNRQPGNDDFELIAKKLTGQAAMDANIGFMYEGQKYTFDLKDTDIYVEKIGGKNYSLSRNEINALECEPSLGLTEAITSIQKRYLKDDKQEPFFAGDFYVFIPTAKLQQLRKKIFERSL